MKEKPTELEWAWIAGIIEGEGYLGHRFQPRLRNGHQQGRYATLTICVRMTDQDIIQRLHEITACGSVTSQCQKPPRQTIYGWRVFDKDRVCWILQNCLPWFGNRRRERAEQMLAAVPKPKPYPKDYIKTLYATGWTQRDIAKEVGICQPIICRILQGKQRSLFYRQRLSAPPVV